MLDKKLIEESAISYIIKEHAEGSIHAVHDFKAGIEWAEKEIGKKVLNLLDLLKLDFKYYIKYIDDPEVFNLDNFEEDLRIINKFIAKIKS